MIKASIDYNKNISMCKVGITVSPYTAKVFYGAETRTLRGCGIKIPYVEKVILYIPEEVSREDIEDTLDVELHGYREELRRELAK